MDSSITFAPLVPWTIVWAGGALALVAIGAAMWRGLSGWWLRALAFLVLLVALTGPQLREEEREGLPNVAFMVVDRSASTDLEDRRRMIDAARAEIDQAVKALSTPGDPFELVTVEVDPGADPRNRGTRLLTALDEAAAQIAPGQIAGAILLTDGQVHDAARIDSFPGPVHTLLAGSADGFDIRLSVETAPTFGIVGESVTFRIKAEAMGRVPADLGGRIMAELSIDGGPKQPILLSLGTETDLKIDITHGGANVIDLRIPVHADELTDRNNRIIASVNGIRDRLRVLLVSGEPHPGGRTWRDLLKSDPTVELIHFTILRPPAKQDGTAVSELSLIAFPTRELFLEKIDGFDLIVFDRYRWRGVLSETYLANVSRYVRNGGAVLIASGPAFAGPESLSRTPLADVIPASPSLNVLERPFLPRVTGLGQRHPVTAGLEQSAGIGLDGPRWGKWLRQIELEQLSGHAVMEGVDKRPLLLLDRVGEGRVAILGSDHAWLWTRGYDGGGPQADLLRRVAHWLMREPELEEEALFAQVEGDRILVERRTLAEDPPGDLTATPPDGSPDRALNYEQAGPGRWQALIEGAESGLWRLQDSEQQAVAAVGPPSPAEYENPLASDAPLTPLVDATGGGFIWLSDGTPRVRAVEEGRRTAGRNWIGLVKRDAHRVTGLDLTPLLPAWLAALLIGALMLGAWLREGRT